MKKSLLKIGKLSFLSVSFIIVSQNSLLAQGCCGKNSLPFSTLEQGLQTPGKLNFSISYEYQSLTKSYLGTDPYSDPLNTKSYQNSINLSAEYGISNRFSFSSVVPFHLNKNYLRFTLQNTLYKIDRDASGVGDAVLLLKTRILGGTIKRSELSIGAGIKIPTGKYKIQDEYGFLPVTLQPGSGAWDGVGWGFFSYTFLKFNTFASGFYRITSTNSRGYRLGNEVLLDLGGGYTFNQNLSGIVLLNFRNVESDLLNGEKVSRSGRTWLNLMPGINFSANRLLSSQLLFTVPVYRNVLGQQIAPTFGITLSNNYSFKI